MSAISVITAYDSKSKSKLYLHVECISAIVNIWYKVDLFLGLRLSKSLVTVTVLVTHKVSY